MAINPEISLQVRQPEQRTALDSYGKMLQFQNLQQRQQLGAQDLEQNRLALEKQRRTADEDLKVRDSYVRSGGDLEKFHAFAVESGVGPDRLLAIQKHNLEIRQSIANIADKDRPAIAERNDKFLTLIDSLEKLPEDQYAAEWPAVQAAVSRIDPKMKLPDQPIPKAELQMHGLGLRTQGYETKRLDGERAAAAELSRIEKEKRDVALHGPALAKATADAQTATATAAGEAPIQPVEQARLDMSKSDNERAERTAAETARHHKAMEQRTMMMAQAGLNSAQNTRVNQVSSQFDSEPIVKRFTIQAEGKAFVDSLGTGAKGNPGDDQAMLYAFAKAMDPESVVREGEYATVQKYAQTWAQNFGFKAERIFSNSPFLTDEARKNMKETIGKKFDVSKRAYDNLHGEYGRRIEKQAGVKNGKEYLSDYGRAFSGTPAAGTPGTVEVWGRDAAGNLVKK